MAAPRLRRSARFLPLVLAALVAIGWAGAGGRADAQVPPHWDHYKVYEANPKPAGPGPILLRDQFGPSGHDVVFLDLFMNPTAKTEMQSGAHYPIHHHDLHYAWWLISEQPFQATIAFENQFGGGQLELGPARYLLNPALKEQVNGPLPVANHYKCYDCLGPPVQRSIRMDDQFGGWVAGNFHPRFFCTPTDKQRPGGPVEPVLDPDQHYICYQFQPPDPQVRTVPIRDQFILTSVALGPGRMLCVPTLKHEVTSTRPRETWGRIKLIYR